MTAEDLDFILDIIANLGGRELFGNFIYLALKKSKRYDINFEELFAEVLVNYKKGSTKEEAIEFIRIAYAKPFDERNKDTKSTHKLKQKQKHKQYTH